MLSLTPATRVFLALAPVDGRKGFNGLHTLVKETLGQELERGNGVVERGNGVGSRQLTILIKLAESRGHG